MPGTLFGPAPRIMDCSGFATLCYKAAGLKDPNGSAFNYNGAGNTTSLIANSTKTDTPNAGDLCFYGGNATNPAHVTVYVGEGQCISMGHAGDPHQGPAESTGPKPFLGYYTPRT
jgi:cell wall-associated NlpC family hydrolase